MAIKYTCPKCNRRFTQWGAEKFGFKCPNDQWRPKDHPDDVELVRLGPSDDRPSRRPTLKKGARKLAVAMPSGFGEETPISDVADLETAAEFQDTPDDDTDSDDDETTDDEVVVEGADEVVADDVATADTDLVDDTADVDADDADSDDDTTEETVEEEWQG